MLRRLLTVGVAAALVSIAALLIGLRVADVRPLSVQTGSMAPTIHPGDLVLVGAIPARQAQRGDVVTFADPVHAGRTLTHRVVAVRRERGRLAFVTRGDANAGSERWTVGAGGRIGRVRTAVPKAGAMLRPIGDPRLRGVLMIALTAALAMVAISFIWFRGDPGCSRAA